MAPASHRALKAAVPSEGHGLIQRGNVLRLLLGWLLAACVGCAGFFNGGLFPMPDDDTADLQPNGCGPSGILGLLVPECPLRLACFTPACNNHDICYGTCGSSREACDTAFHEGMLDVCAGTFGEGSRAQTRCEVLAYIYWQVVVRFGGPFFDRSQQETCASEQITDNTAKAGITEYGTARSLARPFEDKDDDLLPDDWETCVGLNPDDPVDAWLDNDADGLSNLQEFIHDTDPLSPDAS